MKSDTRMITVRELGCPYEPQKYTKLLEVIEGLLGGERKWEGHSVADQA